MHEADRDINGAEDELPYLYLDLFSGNDDYTQFSQSALLYGYVDIRQ